MLLKRTRQIFFIILLGQETAKHLTWESVPWGNWGLAGLSQSCFLWGQEQSRIRVGGCCSNRWSKRFSLLFPFSLLPYSFVKVDGNMSICLWSLWGFFYFKHGYVQQRLERHGGRSCNLYMTEFSGKGVGVRNLTPYVSAAKKISIESQRSYARFAVLVWEQNMDNRYK